MEWLQSGRALRSPAHGAEARPATATRLGAAMNPGDGRRPGLRRPLRWSDGHRDLGQQGQLVRRAPGGALKCLGAVIPCPATLPLHVSLPRAGQRWRAEGRGRFRSLKVALSEVRSGTLARPATCGCKKTPLAGFSVSLRRARLMPIIRILHISDLHSRGSRDGVDKWKRNLLLNAWSRDLEQVHDSEHPIDILCFTGDIADFGKPEEYAATTGIIRTAISSLNLPTQQVFLVPGNHDIDRKIQADAWKAIRDNAPAISPRLLSSWMGGDDKHPPPGLSNDMRTAVLERQKAFWHWVENDLNLAHLLPANSPHKLLGYRTSLNLAKYSFPIHIIGFDSAWLAGDEFDAGNLRLTIDQVGRLVHQDDGEPLPGLKIGLLHHPLSDIADAKDWKQLLSDRIDLLLRGHLHSSSAIEEIEPRRRLRHIASGCLYEGSEGIQHPNSYNVIEIETDDDGQPLSIEIRFRRWSTDSNHWFDDSGLYQGAKNGRYRWDCREVGEHVDAALDLARAQSSETAIAVLKACWDRFEPRMIHRDRVRVLRTLAPAHEACGDAEAASRTYEQVASISRKKTDIEAFKALAHLHRREHAEVIRLSETVLATTPDQELALVALIHASDADVAFSELDKRVPDALRTNGNVLYALGWRAFLAGDDSAATPIVEQGLSKGGDISRFLELQAAIALKKVEARQSNGLRAQLTALERDELERAEISLNTALSGTISARSRARLLYYRGEVLWRLARIEDAIDSFTGLLAADSTVDLDYVERYLDLLMEEQRFSEAERIAKKYLKTHPSLRMALYLARARELRKASPDEISESCRILRDKLSQATTDSDARGFVDAIFWLIRSDPSLEPQEVKALASPRGSVISIALYSQCLTKRGDLPEALAAARTAKQSLEPGSTLEELVHVARALAETGTADGQQDAVHVWDAYLLPRNNPGPWLYQAFELARAVKDERFTRKVHRRLRAVGLETPAIMEHEINYLMQTKSYDEALSAIEQGRVRYADENSVIWNLNLRRSLLGVWLRRPELIESSIPNLIGKNDYPLDVAKTVFVVLRHLDPLAATEFAYQRMRRERDSADVLSFFANSVGAAAPHIPNFDSASEGAAVGIDTTSGRQWVIIETGANPSVTLHEYPPDHPLVRALLGHKLGDVCQIPSPRGTSTCTIGALGSKFIYARDQIWSQWTTSHPETKYVEQIVVPRDAQGDLDMAGFFAIVDELNAGLPSLDDLLQNPVVSPSLLATITGTTVSQAYVYFLGNSAGVFRQAPSAWKDYDAVAAKIDGATEFVLDPLTVVLLVDFDIWPQLEPLAERWAVTHATLDEYRQLLLEWEDGESASLVKKGNTYEVQKRNAEKRREIRAKLAAALDWLERKCTVLGGASVVKVPDAVNSEIKRMFPLSVVQCIAAAHDTGRLLWTDDFAVSVVAEEKFEGLQRAWSQVCFKRFRALGLINDAAFDVVMSHLINSGFDSTEISGERFVRLATMNEWKSEKWNKWLRCLRTTLTTSRELAAASASILNAATVHLAAPEREEFVRRVLGTLTERPDGRFLLREIGTMITIGQLFGINVVGEEIVLGELVRFTRPR